jgi:hypothetical protein
MKPTFLPTLVASLLALAPAVHSASLPVSHIIPNVPWHDQLNGLFCGPGSLEIVFDYWGADIPQKPIANVARSSSIGTWCHDLHRAGHFSVLSSAQGSYFQHEIPTAGFAERPLGYAAFAHSADTIWLDDLKALLAADIPVACLMWYAPDGSGGGHYRVAIGYDDLLGVIYFSDPWGRDLRYLPDMPGVIAWTYAEVEASWNYVAYGTSKPFWGTAIMPWTVDVNVKGKVQAGSQITVTATVTYPCPAPFDSTQFPATNALATITLPTGLTLDGAATLSLGNMAAGSTKTVSWKATVGAGFSGGAVDVQAGGVISGSVPETRWEGQSQSYPPYNYIDLIGGGSSKTL